MAGRHAKPAGSWWQQFLASFTYQPRHSGRQTQVRGSKHRPVARDAAGRQEAGTSLRMGGRGTDQGRYRIGQNAVRQYARQDAIATTARRRPR